MDLRACDRCCVSNLLCVEIKSDNTTWVGGPWCTAAPLSPILLEQCLKGSSTGCCNHPWCGTPLLVSSPVGLTLDSVVESEGCMSADEALHCCYGCLSAFQSAVSVGIQHRDIKSEHVMCVTGGQCHEHDYVLTDWEHAVLEDKYNSYLQSAFLGVSH
jgi:hypothetical protein